MKEKEEESKRDEGTGADARLRDGEGKYRSKEMVEEDGGEMEGDRAKEDVIDDGEGEYACSRFVELALWTCNSRTLQLFDC